jgi:hypothetical protein
MYAHGRAECARTKIWGVGHSKSSRVGEANAQHFSRGA